MNEAQPSGIETRRYGLSLNLYAGLRHTAANIRRTEEPCFDLEKGHISMLPRFLEKVVNLIAAMIGLGVLIRLLLQAYSFIRINGW